MMINPQHVPESRGSSYPDQFKSVVAGRVKKRLGSFAGLQNFGVNLVQLEPGSCSALRHWHSHQDEFIYVLEGEITLVTDAGAQVLQPGMAADFPSGEANGHHLINRSTTAEVYLEVGDRTAGDRAVYPDDDLITQDQHGQWVFTRKDGSPFDRNINSQ
jgi:uncharacterized cupin superfamily protein